MATPTNLFMNWSSVGFTPTGGSLIALDGTTSVKIGRNGTVEKFKGDADKFIRAIAIPTQDRTIEVDLGDVSKAISLLIGSVGIFVATFGDFINRTTAASGGFTITITNAVVIDTPFHGDHAKAGMAVVKFEAFASDGQTDPLTVTAL